ncbi:MAG: type IX secretion system membrane protein PorP/SprF [Flavobacteriaceae bacterium]|jgi:type IX secretion system PorP/SprF family membrane protein|nr:type IX secretion system membrane protein PorP/SprF [Flavobacteriaceae bacterium]
MKNFYSFLFLLTAGWCIQAQQDPQYTQYMYNMNVVNPAYAGSAEGLTFGVLYRSQWVGFDGAPKTYTFAGHAPVGNRVGLGMSVISDEIGPVKETNAYVDFSYTLPVGNVTKLALGVKAGATFHSIGLTGLTLIDSNDLFFSQNVNGATPNVGAGAYLFVPNQYYVSLSMPNLLNSVHLDANGTQMGSETQHAFLAAGYVFDISANFKLKPHAMMKYAFTAPVSVDVNANLFMYDTVEVGLGYRLDDSVSAMMNFVVSPNLRIGYAYDHIQSDLKIDASASHEVFMIFDLNFPRKVSRSPRYF